MIKKLYAVLFSLSLMAALPAFGMEKCTQCNIKDKSVGGAAHTTYLSPLLFSFPLPFQSAHHNLCKNCEHNIQNTNLSPLQQLGCKYCFMQKNQAYAGCSNTRYCGETVLITGVVCYSAYKVYHWWKGEDTQEQDNHDEQDWETEEKHSIKQA